MFSMATIYLETPLGKIYITEKNGFISNIGNIPQKDEILFETKILNQAQQQLYEYFKTERKSFNLPLNPQGSDFQKQVWQKLFLIPYGQTLSYAALAQKINSAPRAIGLACAKNPIPIIIPCHRVIAQNGSLKGYSGFNGLKDKQYLLNLEADSN